MTAVRMLWATVVVAVAALPAAANTFLLTGVVEDAAGPVPAGPLPFVFALVDGPTALWTEEQPAVDVVDGVFVVDVGSANPLPLAVPAGVTLRIVVDGDELPSIPLARLGSANHAARAATAPTATTTNELQQHPAADFVRIDALAAAGAAAVAFSNVTGVPADLADGDDGTVVTSTGGGIVRGENGALGLQDMPGDRFADGSITGNRLPAGSVGPRVVADGTVTGGHVADGALTADDIADVTERELRTTPVYRVDAVGCEAALGTMTTASTCAPSLCNDVLINDKRLQCGNASSCKSPLNTTCPNTPVGALVLP